MNNTYSTTFFRIKELANQKHIPIYYIEQQCGLANGTISKWKNRSVPNSDSLRKVAKYLNVSVDYLIGN